MTGEKEETEQEEVNKGSLRQIERGIRREKKVFIYLKLNIHLKILIWIVFLR